MIERLKDSWQAFKASEPGHRFQDRHDRREKAEHGRWTIGAVLNIVLGSAITLAGLFLMVAPGPGMLVSLFGLALLGSEFAPTARALDWAELKLRSLARWAKGIWDRSPLAIKAILVLLAVAAAAALAYVAYRWLASS